MLNKKYKNKVPLLNQSFQQLKKTKQATSVDSEHIYSAGRRSNSLKIQIAKMPSRVSTGVLEHMPDWCLLQKTVSNMLHLFTAVFLAVSVITLKQKKKKKKKVHKVLTVCWHALFLFLCLPSAVSKIERWRLTERWTGVKQQKHVGWHRWETLLDSGMEANFSVFTTGNYFVNQPMLKLVFHQKWVIHSDCESSGFQIRFYLWLLLNKTS